MDSTSFFIKEKNNIVLIVEKKFPKAQNVVYLVNQLEEMIKRSEGKVELIQQFDNYYEVQSSICELQRLRSLLVKNEKEFLILYKVE